jgi:hypothetical protein
MSEYTVQELAPSILVKVDDIWTGATRDCCSFRSRKLELWILGKLGYS